MKSERLLYHLRNNILNDRSNNVGGSSDRLWTDETLIDYINEAYVRMAAEGLMLRDAVTPEVTQVQLVYHQRDYTLHESVVSVLSARPEKSQFDLTATDHGTLGSQRQVTEHFWDPSRARQLQPGRPLAYTTDEGLMTTVNGSQRMTFRIFPKPGEHEDGEIIRLRVIRKPLGRFEIDNPDYEPEIPREWQLPMLDWAAYLALRIVDDDAGAPARAADFAARFEESVIKAKNQVLAKLRQGQGWGFGRGGFSWETGNNGWC